MKRNVLLAALAALSVVAVKANADTVINDSPLSAPGYYNGSGGVNAGFTVDQNNGIELGLRASNRFPTVIPDGSVIHPTGSVYGVAGGLHSSSPVRSTWNYDYSISLVGTNPQLNLSDMVAKLQVTDVTTGDTTSFNPLDPALGDATNGTLGAQNSENMGFDFGIAVLNPTFFAAHAFDTYDFTLTVSKASSPTTVLASDTIEVVATPLPTTVWQGAALLGGFGLFAASKRRKASLV
jgi:hypothetical protein